MPGMVVLLQTSQADGDTAQMQSHEQIECVAGIGIKGDRYALEPRHVGSRPVEIEGVTSDMGGQYPEGANTHWHLPEVGRQLTIFDVGALQRLQESSGLNLTPELTRRNVLVEGLDLNGLVGQELVVGMGGARVFVHRLTVPCQNLERRANLPGLEEALWNDGGISCEIVQSGMIRVGDVIELVPDSLDPARINTPKIDAFLTRPSDRTEEDQQRLASMNAILAEAQARAHACTSAEETPVTEADPAGETAQDQGGQGWLRYIRDLVRGVARL
jgi:MOSC domain-containing protein YiiM